MSPWRQFCPSMRAIEAKNYEQNSFVEIWKILPILPAPNATTGADKQARRTTHERNKAYDEVEDGMMDQASREVSVRCDMQDTSFNT